MHPDNLGFFKKRFKNGLILTKKNWGYKFVTQTHYNFGREFVGTYFHRFCPFVQVET